MKILKHNNVLYNLENIDRITLEETAGPLQWMVLEKDAVKLYRIPLTTPTVDFQLSDLTTQRILFKMHRYLASPGGVDLDLNDIIHQCAMEQKAMEDEYNHLAEIL